MTRARIISLLTVFGVLLIGLVAGIAVTQNNRPTTVVDQYPALDVDSYIAEGTQTAVTPTEAAAGVVPADSPQCFINYNGRVVQLDCNDPRVLAEHQAYKRHNQQQISRIKAISR